VSDKPRHYDVIILGGGAAGLMCALVAGQRGKKVLVLEVSNKVGKKILMSGGGRCNFTNLDVQAEHFICNNPHFVKSALAQFTQWDFIAMVGKHGIAYHEKDHGQLFCDNSAKDILKMLLSECDLAGVEIQLNCTSSCVVSDSGYLIETSVGRFQSPNLVVATGGLSIPSLGGATAYGYALAEQFGLTVNPTQACLVPFTLTGDWHQFAQQLSGVAIPIVASVPGQGFAENLLFTHRGLSGPAILQLSNYWHLGENIKIDLLPSKDVAALLMLHKKQKPSSTVSAALAGYLPKSLINALQPLWWRDMALQEIKDAELRAVAEQFHHWQLKPSGTEGYRTAEVTRGGVDVSQISSKTLQVEAIKGLYFIGEVVDVTGHLGGFNFQWAWSSGVAAGNDV
jgi:predicted Rossmann fold flavoprotein